MRKVSTKNPTKTLEALWKNITPKQKETLLKVRGLSKTWARTKTIKEMVSRGGGMVASDLLKLIRTYKSKNPQLKEIRFRK